MADGIEVGRAHVAVTADGTEAIRNVQRDFTRGMPATGKKAGGALSSGLLAGVKGIAGPIAALFAVDKVVDFFKSANEEAREAQKVGARTTNVIKTTGSAANVTAKQVSNLATAISKKTGIDDEAIQATSNLVLGFTRIRNEAGKGNDVFNRTTQLATDMGAAMGKTGASQAKILGKALNDPIKGTSALARVGITFTDQQKKQIAEMVKSGKTLDAQKLILGEVEKRYGGAAEAGATAGDKLRVSWDNFKEQVGTAVLPLVDKLATFLTDKILPAASRFVTSLKPLAAGVSAFFAAFREGDVTSSGLVGMFERAGVAVRNFLNVFRGGGAGGGLIAGIVAQLRGLVAVVIPIVRQIVGTLLGQFRAMRPQIQGIWTSIKTIVTGVMFIIREVIQAVTTIIRLIWARWGTQITAIIKTVFRGLVNIISGVMKAIAGIIKLVVALIKGDWRGAWNAIKQIFSGVWQAIRGIVTVATAAIRQVVASWLAKVRSLWTAGFNAVRSFTSNLMASIRDKISDILSRIRDRFRSGVDAIGRAWDALKDKAKAPIRFVVETVINKGLIGAFNKIAGIIPGVNRLPNVSVGFAKGGWTGPGPKMKPAGVVHADEYVINKASRRRIEQDSPGLLDALNGYATGGLVGGSGRFTSRFAAILMMAQRMAGQGFNIFQRGFRPATSYSGTSHAGDAVDLGPATARIVAILRALGVAAWRRGPGFPGGFSTSHIHGVPLPGRGSAGGSGIWQARNYLAGGDGLGGRDYEARGGIGGLLGKLGAFLKSGFTSIVDWFKDLVKDPLAKLAGIRNSPLGQLAAGTANLAFEGMRKRISDVGFANGTTYAPPGWARVGERGREWVNFRGGEQVLPHGAGPGGVVITGGQFGYTPEEIAVSILREQRHKQALNPVFG